MTNVVIAQRGGAFAGPTSSPVSIMGESPCGRLGLGHHQGTGRCYAKARGAVQGEGTTGGGSTVAVRRGSALDPHQEAERLEEPLEAGGGDRAGGPDADRLALVLVPELQVEA